MISRDFSPPIKEKSILNNQFNNSIQLNNQVNSIRYNWNEKLGRKKYPSMSLLSHLETKPPHGWESLIGKQCPTSVVLSLDYCCRRKCRPREGKGFSFDRDPSSLCRISNSWMGHKAKVLQRWFLGSMGFFIMWIKFAYSTSSPFNVWHLSQLKSVSGGISKTIHLCSIDDVNLHSFWVPEPKAKVNDNQ